VHEPTLADLFGHYQLMKRDAVAEPDEDNDIPMLLYVGEGPLAENVPCEVLCIVVSGGRDDMCQCLAAVMAQHFIPHWAAICSDGFVAKHADVPPEYLRAGGLIEMAAGKLPGVRECLTITAADHDGHVYANSRTYWFDTDGDIWFDDDDGPGDKMSGPMIDVLTDVTSLWGKSKIEVLQTIMERGPFMN